MRAQTAPPSTDAAQSDATAQFSTADALWAHIEDLKRGPQARPKTTEEFVIYLKQIDSAAQDFTWRFYGDSRKWDAMMIHAQIGGTLARLSGQGIGSGAIDGIESVAKEIIAAPDASAATREDARFNLLQIQCARQGYTPELEKDLETFSRDYPGEGRVDVLKLYVAKKVESSDPAKADAIFGELRTSSNQQVAAEAAGALKMEHLQKQPLDLKYTAMDGAKIDLAKMRGKVILVDFWATWCGPCMREAPNVVAAYNKYHDKGFEVVGISLDKDEDAVLKVTKANGMTWPQYFDGKGWQNSISSSFGINSIPTMWLVNKEGLIASTEARDNLDSEIEKLLGE